jgi:putative phosphoribosyl transferase
MAKHDEVRLVSIPAATAQLEGILDLPEDPRGVVAFVHGSGSSRHSPRNRFVAQSLRSDARVGTLLFDLLSAAEEQEDVRTARLRFDVELLAARVEAATAWLHDDPDASGLPIGYFGASTGAAAALIAAARRPREVAAVVSRGGRPDLAGPEVLARVRAPTLLIVGGEDLPVIDLNREALRAVRTECRLDVVPNASHLFEEPGALEQVARRAAAWFETHFVALALAAGMLLAAVLAAPASFAQGKRLTLTSADFANGEGIPPQFTCDGPGTSPELSWSNVPPGTQSLALVVHDPDSPGGDFAHWIVYDIPANATGIPLGAASNAGLPAGAVQGTNGKGAKGWTPPCPPKGTHHYQFELYALDAQLPSMRASTEPALFAAMRGHVLDRARIVATYEGSR